MRRPVPMLVAAILVAGALVAIGRWERSHAARSQNAAMRQVLEDAGTSLTARPISGYRRDPFACLAYEETPVTFALQLCFDSAGRLVETVDRRSGVPKYASLTWEPSLAKVMYKPARIQALIAQASRLPKRG